MLRNTSLLSQLRLQFLLAGGDDLLLNPVDFFAGQGPFGRPERERHQVRLGVGRDLLAAILAFVADGFEEFVYA